MTITYKVSVYGYDFEGELGLLNVQEHERVSVALDKARSWAFQERTTSVTVLEADDAGNGTVLAHYYTNGFRGPDCDGPLREYFIVAVSQAKLRWAEETV